MTDTTVKASNWRYVETGRIVLISKGADEGKLATVVDIVDHKRVLIDGPSITRQPIALAHVVLTPHVIALPRGARSATVTKKWEASGIDAKWAASSWAKKIAQRATRKNLSDFERFQVVVLKKQRRYAVKKALAKA